MTDTPAEREAESTWTRLRRRKVVQWGLVYVAAAWGFLQGLEYVSEAFHWPEQLRQIALLALVIGLPIVLVLAWYHGDRGEQRFRGTELVIIALLFLIGGGIFWRFSRVSEVPSTADVTAEQEASPPVPSQDTPAPDQKSIAVLPFVDMSAAKDQEYMSDGIAEELLNLLAKVPDLKVIARTSSFAFKGQSVEVAEIAKRLNVAHVLEGSVRKSGNKVRITTQLIRAADSTHLWSETYDRTLDDIFAVQDDIAKRVTDALKVALRANGQLAAGGKRDIEAYQLQLQARHFGQSARYSSAVEYLRKSLERDPTSAQVWVDLATIEIARADYGEVPPVEGYSAGRVAVQRALGLDPDLAQAHSTLGWVQAYDLEWGSAEDSTRRALALESGNATVLLQAGWTIAELGRLSEGLELIEKSIELNPLEIRGYDIQASVQLALHKFKDAESTVRMLQALRPGEFEAAIGWALLLQGKPTEAKAFIDKDPSELDRLYALSGWYHSQGQHAESDAALERIKSQYAGDIHAYHIAELHAFRGEDDLAFEWLDRAFEERESQITDIKISFDFQRFHGDPRYKAFLKKMKLPESPST